MTALLIRVADPHHFNADPEPSSFHYNADPDPAFHFYADPAPHQSDGTTCLKTLHESRLHSEPRDLDSDRLLFQFEPLMRLNFNFNADSGPAFHSNADPDPDPASKNNADSQLCF